MPLCLTKQELQEVTNKKRFGAQRAVLNMMGIDHKIRPDGSLFVTYEAVQIAREKRKKVEPHWEEIG